MKRHDDWLKEQLQNPGFAAEYPTVAADDPEPVVVLSAQRKGADPQGQCVAEVAARAGIPDENLYHARSPKGNPRWSTLAAILRATGLQL